MIEIIRNPYAGIDFTNAQTVKAVSHEHVYSSSMVARMYDRGIRFFCHVHYQPAVPRVPLSNISGTFEDWCYYDASGYYTTGDKTTKPTFDAVSARKAVPLSVENTTTNFRNTGLTVAYLDSNRDNKWTQLVGNPDDYSTWDVCCEDESAWVERTWDDVDENLVKNTKTTAYSIPTFTSKSSVSEYQKMSAISFAGDGLVHNTDDFPQIPNAEHTTFEGLGHFNVIGSRTPEAAWSFGATIDWRMAHRWLTIDDIATLFTPESSFYDGKLFGTQNHNESLNQFRTLQDRYSFFKGFEVYNNGLSRAKNTSFMESFHTLLNEGREIYCLAVTDWQLECICSDVDGGTNVLYVPSNYDSLSVADKSKAGMDCYIGGKFIASRFGSKKVVDFSIDTDNDTAHFKVNGIAKTISLVFNGQRVSMSNTDEITCDIPKWAKNITAEAYFADGNGDVWKSDTKLADDSDFIFTQAIVFKVSKKDKAMDEKIIMFALE